MTAYPALRMRRLRKDPFSRALVRESRLSVDDLIQPVFVCEGTGVRQAVPSMPGVERLSVDLLIERVKRLDILGIKAVALFPVIEAQHKTLDAKEAFNPEGVHAVFIHHGDCHWDIPNGLFDATSGDHNFFYISRSKWYKGKTSRKNKKDCWNDFKSRSYPLEQSHSIPPNMALIVCGHPASYNIHEVIVERQTYLRNRLCFLYSEPLQALLAQVRPQIPVANMAYPGFLNIDFHFRVTERQVVGIS